MKRPLPAPATYAELQVTTNFTFLTGGSHPQELVAQAKALGLAALAITDNTRTAGDYDGYGGTVDYGTSSNHQAGIALHCYADGHVGQVTPEIDTALMLNLHTRAGSEPTSEQP